MRWPRFLVILALGGLHLAQPGAAVVSAARKTELMEQVRGLFDHGLDSYLKHAFPAVRRSRPSALRSRIYHLTALAIQDELRPLSCRGTDPYSASVVVVRARRNATRPVQLMHLHAFLVWLRSGGEIKDVCGDYSMTLIDVIDTFVVLGDRDGFERGPSALVRRDGCVAFPFVLA